MSKIGTRLIKAAKEARAIARGEITDAFVVHVPDDVDEMNEIKTVQDVYTSIDTMVAELNSLDFVRLANTLSFRVHEVAWTSGSELLEELQTVMSEALRTDGDSLPSSIKQEIENILRGIERVLADIRARRRYYAPKVGSEFPRRGVLVERKKKH
jgi:hypothetical protein